MDQYKIKSHVGEGAHGYVMRAINKTNNQNVALKKLLLKSLNDGIPNNILREIKTLQQIKHEYVLQLYDVIPEAMGFVLVMEYLPSNLSEMIKNADKPLSEAHIKKYMEMLLRGIAYLHDHNIMHRDLKPSNLLIASNGTLKIADFGLARLYTDTERPYSHQVATRWYRAPELLYGARHYTPAIDMWAVGCILAEMINKTPLFPGETDIDQLALVLRTLGTPTAEQWPSLKTLPDYNKITFPQYAALPWAQILPESEPYVIDYVKRFLNYNHLKRITAKQALIEEYFCIKPLASDLHEMPKPNEVDEHFYFYQPQLNFESLLRPT